MNYSPAHQSYTRAPSRLDVIKGHLAAMAAGWFGYIQQLLQKLNAVDLPRFKTILQCTMSFRQFLELGFYPKPTPP